MKICEYCEKEYIPNKFAAKRQRFCSKECNAKWRYHNPQSGSYICLGCGSVFIPKSKENNKYCSRECYFKTIEAKPKEKTIVKCAICSKEFEGRVNSKACGPQCKEEWIRRREQERYNQYKATEKYQRDLARGREKYEPKEPIEKKCGYCGKEYKTPYQSKYCVECRPLAEAKNKTEADRARREKIRGVFVAPVSRVEVYNRDNWVCGICKKPVDKKLSFPHPMSPSLDHVIPIARGGTHEPDNVQLAHFICNSYKRDTVCDIAR